MAGLKKNTLIRLRYPPQFNGRIEEKHSNQINGRIEEKLSDQIKVPTKIQ